MNCVGYIQSARPTSGVDYIYSDIVTTVRPSFKLSRPTGLYYSNTANRIMDNK